MFRPRILLAHAIPFQARFEPAQALLPDGSLMPDGWSALGFVTAFASRHADIDPVPASLTLGVSLPEAEFDALWSTLATGRRDLRATVRINAGPFEHVLPPGWRWNTTVESHLRVSRVSVVFTGAGWSGG